MKAFFARISLILLLLGGMASAASAKDAWIRVRSKNFLLIGNASEKEIRHVAQSLERFRSALAKLFKNADLSSPVATNVIVFRDQAAYAPYKPLRPDGSVDSAVQGYFRSGFDVNYITITIGHGDNQTFRNIFHEYVHFAVSNLFPKMDVPAWFNEGLAEYYSTFALTSAGAADVGGPIKAHIDTLEKSPLLSLDTLLVLRSSSVNSSSISSRALFYAESWALVHYLLETRGPEALHSFVKAVVAGTPLQAAFKSAFNQDYRSVEAAFKTYVDHRSYRVEHVELGKADDPAVEVLSNPLSSAYTSSYLGDLLYHLDRLAEAEASLLSALKDDPSNEIANADLGLIRFEQKKFDDACKYLDIAAASEKTSAPILYRYAYVLSREAFDASGDRIELEPATASKIRKALRRAMSAAPTLTESYDLLAALDLADNQDLDEAAAAMESALRYEPARNDYALRLADVYLRQKRYDPARLIAKRVSSSSDPELKRHADSILDYIQEREASAKRTAATGSAEPVPLGPKTDPPMSRAEVEEANALATLRSINADLRTAEPGETRAVGTLDRIDCSNGKINFDVHVNGGDLLLNSRDFQRLTLRTFDKDAAGAQIGCDSPVKSRTAVVTYNAHFELVALEFVPSNFRFLAADEINQPRAHLVRQDQVDSEGYSLQDPASGSAAVLHNVDSGRSAILTALGPAGEGEKRDIGYLQGIECGTGLLLLIRTSAGVLDLESSSPQTIRALSFVPAVPATTFTCSSKLIDLPLLVTYKPANSGTGVITSLAIVPRDFKLD